jgi:peptidoglycan/xylan/chitin deacetylase (PgdA/CDA1 family)
MLRAADRYTEIFGRRPEVHGAAGWQMNEAAYRVEAELGYRIASDTRGREPFWPVDADGVPLGPLQLPTTLPTLDELIGRNGWDAGNVHRALLALTEDDPAPQVFTLHAELEGRRLAATFERLLAGWRSQGRRLVGLTGLAAALDGARLPRCRPMRGTVAGRSGTLAVGTAS